MARETSTERCDPSPSRPSVADRRRGAGISYLGPACAYGDAPTQVTDGCVTASSSWGESVLGTVCTLGKLYLDIPLPAGMAALCPLGGSYSRAKLSQVTCVRYSCGTGAAGGPGAAGDCCVRHLCALLARSLFVLCAQGRQALAPTLLHPRCPIRAGAFQPRAPAPGAPAPNDPRHRGRRRLGAACGHRIASPWHRPVRHRPIA